LRCEHIARRDSIDTGVSVCAIRIPDPYIQEEQWEIRWNDKISPLNLSTKPNKIEYNFQGTLPELDNTQGLYGGSLDVVYSGGGEGSDMTEERCNGTIRMKVGYCGSS